MRIELFYEDEHYAYVECDNVDKVHKAFQKEMGSGKDEHEAYNTLMDKGIIRPGWAKGYLELSDYKNEE